MKQNNYAVFTIKSVALLLLVLTFLLTGCQNRKVNQGRQFIETPFNAPFNSNQPKLDIPVNISDYVIQVEKIKQYAPALYQQNKKIYRAIDDWINQSLGSDEFYKVGLASYEMAGKDGMGNVFLTGYYTPIIKARHKPTGKFKYPIYRMPATGKNVKLPTRQQIYSGVLAGKGLEIAYSDSLIDNFIMEVQGSGYIDFEDGSPLVFFRYAGKNGYEYTSIGRLLVEQGQITKEKMSMQSIRDWAERQSSKKVEDLLMQNRSFVFFKPEYNAEVKGALGVPLIANASVAADKILIPNGAVLLVDVPLLENDGEYHGRREIRLMVALDAGGAIKGHHFDLYLGVGDEAGKLAGYYKHYGRTWVIQP
ncbi:murein transglycosylase A [Orbaceae bacterium ESL0721]|nr:murein transglycosylase A [Orbaceae bacterium ESL0721]